MAGQQTANIALCSNCYDGRIIANKIDEMLIYFCNMCFCEVKIETFIYEK